MLNPLLSLSALLSLAALGQSRAVTITVDCGTGSGFLLCQREVNVWAKKTGNTVKALQTPNDSGAKLGYFQQLLAARDSGLDVYQLDVVWPGVLGRFFVDLRKYIPKEEINQHFPSIIANNTFDGKLIAMPWYTDAGLLYYRTDLLKKYGYSAPPKTWTELAAMAQKIQSGERGTNPKINGFVFQGKNYEGLTCDALEWVSSYGGGGIVDPSGKITVNNPRAVAAIKEAGSWVGTISPQAVGTYNEEDARGVFQGGNAVFMRNWPYAYALAQDPKSPVAGKVGVAPLPAGPGGQSAACLGGWQLGVSSFSKNPAVAADLVRYLTSRDVQKARAIEGSFNPTIASLYKDPQVLKAVPFFGSLYNVFTNAVARPSTPTQNKYNAVSSAFSNAVYTVLSGKQSADAALRSLQRELTRIKGRAW